MKLLTDFIFVSGIVVIMIILFSLFKKQRKELPHRILIFLFVMLLLLTIHFYAYLHKIKWLFILTLLFEDPIEWLAGPLLFIYVKSLFSNKKDLIKKNLIHFIPYFVYFIFISIPVLISYILDRPAIQYLEFIDDNEPLEILLFAVQAPYLLLYAILSLRLLNKYRQSLKQNFSNLLEKDLTWVKYLLIGMIVTISIDISTTIYELTYGELEWDTGFLTVAVLILVIIFLGYYGSSQSQILLPDFLINQPEQFVFEKNEPPKTHSLSHADDSEIEILKTRLIEVLENEKPYLNEDLTLGGLAKMLPTTDKKLSALINHSLEITFYDLINSYRIEEVKMRLTNSDFENYTLLAIAFDSGFKSKTSFNRIFKKVVGCSPSVYKKNATAQA